MEKTLEFSGVFLIFKAFSYCTSLMSITIPDSVTNIGNYAFEHCINLKSIKYRSTEEQWGSITKGNNWLSNVGTLTITYNYIDE